MLQCLSRFLLFKVMGWKVDVSVPHEDKCILCVAPHTSNMDFLIGKLYYWAIGRNANFLMKKEWFFWPLGSLLRAMGGIPVYRDANHSLTDQLAEKAAVADRFELAVTPEGTRSPRTEWKKGFYFIAQKARIPIMLYAIDYGKKCIVCHKSIRTDEMTADEAMTFIKDYFKDFTPKHPEKFVY